MVDMSKDPRPVLTFESSVAEGAGVGASMEEVRKIHDLIKQEQPPADVQPSFEVSFGKDWAGDPAVWVWFRVLDDQNPSAGKISRLNQFANSVRDRLLGANIKYWPYIDFRTVRESQQ
jgi:hypothetical protein